MRQLFSTRTRHGSAASRTSCGHGLLQGRRAFYLGCASSMVMAQMRDMALSSPTSLEEK